MSAPKTPIDCFVYPDASGRIDVPETCARITAYAAEKVREAVETLTKERDAARKEVADLRARVEAMRKALPYALSVGDPMKWVSEMRVKSALDLTREFKEGV